MLFTDPFPCILLRLWIRWCYIHTDMGGGDRKRRAIHFKTFKSLHVIFLFSQAKKASRESQGYVCIGRIHLALCQKSLYTPGKSRTFSQKNVNREQNLFAYNCRFDWDFKEPICSFVSARETLNPRLN